MSENEKNRYVQPNNVKEAMTTIQDLFNQYRKADLTMELLKYHQNLVLRLESDIHDEAIREDNHSQLITLEKMIADMQFWTKQRMTNKPFMYKMKNFKLVNENHQKFKRNVIKGGKAGGSHRGSIH
ncbi:hypothetical protein FC70_GL001526 [Paucilactobacillus oligofermentans DSM 15707 = LMG 22743]|uniref:Uncharacterized protein n=1 Tax=Paucilactobacillus oligofermentans DSM 15707 = LMG 22743 TaxID=1423778 RepID=A0A0R1RD01_9LACO|nr:hypothetical protein [Paucilactobacillus oligofermentans]KRL54727.1 hypothetical protein FC70_GL001526 [Paucilactobacillus oligofermentans DSM 15707 = LMG 22743]CUS26362.1 Uncharacterized protein LACOL_1054 [Paucilactobacillus oligofermentans DSM 15707 = LMG 22743]